MPTEQGSTDPKHISEILADTDAVLAGSEDSERTEEVRRTDITHEIQSLEEQRVQIIKELIEGTTGPKAVDELSRTEVALERAKEDLQMPEGEEEGATDS